MSGPSAEPGRPAVPPARHLAVPADSTAVPVGGDGNPPAPTTRRRRSCSRRRTAPTEDRDLRPRSRRRPPRGALRRLPDGLHGRPERTAPSRRHLDINGTSRTGRRSAQDHSSTTLLHRPHRRPRAVRRRPVVREPKLGLRDRPPNRCRRDTQNGPPTETFVTVGSPFRYSAVREGGVEPPRPFGHWNLNPARLPIPPPAHGCCLLVSFTPWGLPRPVRRRLPTSRTLARCSGWNHIRFRAPPSEGNRPLLRDTGMGRLYHPCGGAAADRGTVDTGPLGPSREPAVFPVRGYDQ